MVNLVYFMIIDVKIVIGAICKAIVQHFEGERSYCLGEILFLTIISIVEL